VKNLERIFKEWLRARHFQSEPKIQATKLLHAKAIDAFSKIVELRKAGGEIVVEDRNSVRLTDNETGCPDGERSRPEDLDLPEMAQCQTQGFPHLSQRFLLRLNDIHIRSLAF
jgi:hypothetical protein